MFITWLFTASTTSWNSSDSIIIFDLTAVLFVLWGCFFHFIGICLTSGGFSQILLPSEVKGGLSWVCVLCGGVERCVIVANVWRTAEISRSHTWRPVDWCMKLLWPTQRTRRRALSASFTDLLPCLLDLSGALSSTNDFYFCSFVCVSVCSFSFSIEANRLNLYVYSFLINY